jgi:hypothetical protein
MIFYDCIFTGLPVIPVTVNKSRFDNIGQLTG